MSVDFREIIRRTEHTVVRHITVSKRDVLARYPKCNLNFTGVTPERDPVPATFEPTHRVLLVSNKNGDILAHDFIQLLDQPGPVIDLYERGDDPFLSAVTPEDFQQSSIGVDVVKEPTYLHDPKRGIWWRYKVPKPELSNSMAHIATIDYLEDGPRQNLNLSFENPIGFVYFLQEDRPNGAIKVGYSKDSQKRLQAHQTSNSVKLKLLVDVPGAFEDETMLHHLFQGHRTGGGEEWFKAEPVLQWLREQHVL